MQHLFSFPITCVRLDQSKVETNVSVDIICDAFIKSIKVTAFDGEVVLWIHLSYGHFLNWSAALVKPDTCIKTITPINTYQEGLTLPSVIDAINLDGGLWSEIWWAQTAEILREKLSK